MSPIESHWYRPQWWLTLALAPLSWLYGTVAALRRLGYRQGWYRAERLPVPLVVIGNINVGGVGKTPLALALIEALSARGVPVGIVSRGYGGSLREPALISAETDPALCGDEPLLLAAAGVPVAVGRDRPAAARLLLARHPDLELLLCDDGLQHYRLARDLEIAVLDGARGLGNGRLLPAGPLREPATRLRTVDALVINGDVRAPLPLPPGVPQFAMRLAPDDAYRLSDPAERRAPGGFAGLRVVALAGIGHPQRFFDTLQALGIRPVREIAFPDHHAYRAEDLPDDADAILVTAKDAAKLRRFNHDKLWVLPVRARLAPDLADWILARLKAK